MSKKIGLLGISKIFLFVFFIFLGIKNIKYRNINKNIKYNIIIKNFKNKNLNKK